MSSVKTELNDDERRDWLRLIRSENVGPATFWQLLEHYGSAAEALTALPDLAHRGGKPKKIGICSERAVDRELDKALKLGARFICAPESVYPPSLKATPASPPVICVRGDSQLLTGQMIAIVGARNASASGRKLAQTIAKDLGRAGLVVVSGLARGIDTAAHHGALDSGTVAVLAGGVDCPYPPENKDLYAAISSTGLIISEQPINYVAQARDFPKRNRIVSGLALGVVIVEASVRSGSLITANFAADQGRDVFAVPGSPLDPRARGPNRLIRDGAALVESAEHVLHALKLSNPLGFEHPDQTPASPMNAAHVAIADKKELETIREKLIALMGPTPTSIDELIRLSQASPAAVHNIVLEFELAGHIERHPGGRVSWLGL